MQAAVCADLPPCELRAHLLEYEPGGDVCFVVEVRDNDLVARAQRLPHGQADQPDEGSSIHAERDFLGSPRIDERGDAGAGTSDGGVHCHALRVAPSPLHVVSDQVMIHRIQHDLRYLCARSVVEKDGAAGLFQCGELLAQGCRRKVRHRTPLVQRNRRDHTGPVVHDRGEIRPAALALGGPGPSGGPGPQRNSAR